MRYIKVSWIHSFDDEPILLYSEINDEMFEERKIEVYRDDSFGLASQNFEFGGAALGDVPIPSIEDIAQDPEFLPVEITKEEFEQAWLQYTDYLNQK